MDHFRCAANAHVVKTDHVLITGPIAAAIKYGIGVKSFSDVQVLRNYHPKMSPTVGFMTPLNRIDDMIVTMGSQQVTLPPISVHVRTTIDGEYYDIVDGRHRLAASVILGYIEIPVIFV